MAIYAREAYCKGSDDEDRYFEPIVGANRKGIIQGVYQITVFIISETLWANDIWSHKEALIQYGSEPDPTAIYQVVFTGHSSGGVLALYAALAFKRKHPSRPVNVVTFGSPRPGDQDFINHVTSIFPQLYRVTNFKDFLPHIGNKYEGYRHPHTEYWISNEEDCNCPEDFGPILYKCLPKVLTLNGKFIDENPYCHGGTIPDKGADNIRSNKNPYFGILLSCSGIQDSMLGDI
ncbi:hypothetical protein G9A89_020125 [Geosiphon pyriformis]|nr:hypothetical protein G9A89_020125 [Geosiphon pyriformis]